MKFKIGDTEISWEGDSIVVKREVVGGTSMELKVSTPLGSQEGAREFLDNAIDTLVRIRKELGS